MLKMKKELIAGITVGLVILMATPAFARSISLKGAAVALWIFIIIGAIIVLLQLIPAIILFFSFIGTTAGLVAKQKKAMEEVGTEEKEKLRLPGYEPTTVEK